VIIYVWAYFAALPKSEMLLIMGEQQPTEA
jgi:hypothetical protein